MNDQDDNLEKLLGDIRRTILDNRRFLKDLKDNSTIAEPVEGEEVSGSEYYEE